MDDKERHLQHIDNTQELAKLLGTINVWLEMSRRCSGSPDGKTEITMEEVNDKMAGLYIQHKELL